MSQNFVEFSLNNFEYSNCSLNVFTSNIEKENQTHKIWISQKEKNCGGQQDEEVFFFRNLM